MSTPETDSTETNLKLNIIVGEEILTGTLNNNASGRDFASLLPITVTLSDYHQIEKVSDLPRTLSIKGAPPGYKPSIGDITYYAPWGNLAIFYQNFPYAAGLVHLGKIESDPGVFHSNQPFIVTIELDSRC